MSLKQTTIPLLELFIKCSLSSRQEKGACLMDQQWFMVYYALVQRGVIDLRVTPVCLESPPANYEQLNAARRLPAAWIQKGSFKNRDMTGIVASTTDELELLMEVFQVPMLCGPRQNERVLHAEKSFDDVYRDTMQFLKLNKNAPLVAALEKLDAFIRQSSTKYLLSNELSYPDCLLMPKLQHMRVVLRAYRNWDIPKEFTGICRYLKTMYQTPAFKSSCPTDRDILLHYGEKNPLPSSVDLRNMGDSRLSTVAST